MNQRRSATIGDTDIEAILHRVERLLKYVDHSQAICNTMFDTIRRDCESLVHELEIQKQERGDGSVLSVPGRQFMDISAEDSGPDMKKIQQTFDLLLKYPDGATTDEISRVMKRHRTTISFYLNRLVDDGKARKDRIGHEFYYRAIVNNNRGTSE